MTLTALNQYTDLNGGASGSDGGGGSSSGYGADGRLRGFYACHVE